MNNLQIVLLISISVLLINGFVIPCLVIFLKNRAKEPKREAEPVTVKEKKSKTKAEKPVRSVKESPKAQDAVKEEEPVAEEEADSQSAEEEEKTAAVEASEIVAREQSESEEEGEEESEELTERKLVVEDGNVKYIIIKYSKSFQAKIIQSDATAKDYYSQLKNYLLSYNGVKSRMSWRWETFRFGRKTLAKLRMRGKTLSVVLALDPEKYADTKYIVESVADVSAYEDTPCLYRIKNDRRVKYAKELIDEVMAGSGLTKGLIEENVDYASMYPYEATERLVERKLIKVLTEDDAQSGTVFKPSDVRKSVKATEVDTIMKDEVAEILIERSDEASDRTKVGIVNIDELSRYFLDGETVDLAEVKKRVKGFNAKVTYLKVLARGTIDKKLTVKADAFSLQAVKMILLTGGKVIKKSV